MKITHWIVVGMLVCACLPAPSTWSAPRDVIVFSETIEDGGARYDTLWLMYADGSDAVQIFSWSGVPVESKGTIQHPKVSPDGQWITFLSDHDGIRNLSAVNVFAVAPDGTGLRQLSGGNNTAGQYLDGTQPAQTGTIAGTVYGNFPYTANSANVYLEGTTLHVVAGADGSYSINNVPIGNRFVIAYTTTFSHWGVAPAQVTEGLTFDVPAIEAKTEVIDREKCKAYDWAAGGTAVCYEFANKIYRAPADKSTSSQPLPGMPEDLYIDRFAVSPLDGRLALVVNQASDQQTYPKGIWIANSECSGLKRLVTFDLNYTTNVLGLVWAREAARFYLLWQGNYIEGKSNVRIAQVEPDLISSPFTDYPETDTTGWTWIATAIDPLIMEFGGLTGDDNLGLAAFAINGDPAIGSEIATLSLDGQGTTNTIYAAPGKRLSYPSFGRLDDAPPVPTATATTPPAASPTPTTPPPASATPSPTPHSGALLMDGNHDGIVNQLDLLLLMGEWHQTAP